MEYAGEVRDFIVNLTSMSNEKLFRLKEEGENEIKAYLRKNNITVKQSTRTDPRKTASLLPKF
jgi:hypothetical protein